MTMETKKKKKIEPSGTSESTSLHLSPSTASLIHITCILGMVFSFYVARFVQSIDLIPHTSLTLRLISGLYAPIVILLYSFIRQQPKKCSYVRAVVHGVLALPVGALVNALGAIALGAPVGIQYLPKTISWSFMMSAFTFAPAASVFGSEWNDWLRIFAQTKLMSTIDYMTSLPAHGAVIGAWFGAWPMPLDWERPWQEWPICVSYGAIMGYLLGIAASLGFILLSRAHLHVKAD